MLTWFAEAVVKPGKCDLSYLVLMNLSSLRLYLTLGEFYLRKDSAGWPSFGTQFFNCTDKHWTDLWPLVPSVVTKIFQLPHSVFIAQ